MKISVVPAQWPGDTSTEIRKIVELAARTEVETVWFSEVNGYDAISLASAMAASGATQDMNIAVGPLPIGTRDPAQLAMGLATVQAFNRGNVSVALGASSPTIIERWHGGRAGDPVKTVESYVPALRAIVSGEVSDHRGPGWSSEGFRLVVPPIPSLQVVIAALGEKMLNLAGAIADRVVANLVTAKQVPDLRAAIEGGSRSRDREAPPLTLWLMAGSRDHSLDRAARLLRAYGDAPGYAQRLRQSGLEDAVRNDPKIAADRLGAFGSSELNTRLDQFDASGVDEVALVLSGADPEVSRLLEVALSR